MKNAENLPGYKKKSFALAYNGGEIWFEHLDGIYDEEELVLKKLAYDVQLFTRPSVSGYICFVFDETNVTDKILFAVRDSILKSKKRFMKVAFSNLDRKSKHKLQKEFAEKGVEIAFFDGLEYAKQWLLPT